MEIIIYSDKRTWIHTLDPRTRILAAIGASAVLALCHHTSALSLGLAVGFVTVIVARVPAPALLQRVVPLNVLLVLLFASLLFFTPGQALFELGSIEASYEGFYQGSVIWLKANSIVLLMAALLGTIEMVALGHALNKLKVPPVLTHILLFTIRYMGLMLSEFDRLSRAAQLRGFVPGANRHTLRTTGYMVGMMLVRSYARGERILNAMRLRGFNGTLAFEGEFAYGRRDGYFAILAGVALACILGLEWQ